MPFKSKLQRGWMFAAQARGELPEGTAERWARETPNMGSLPKRAKKKTRKDVEEHAHHMLNRMRGSY